jgi:hypothetical protein
VSEVVVNIKKDVEKSTSGLDDLKTVTDEIKEQMKKLDQATEKKTRKSYLFYLYHVDCSVKLINDVSKLQNKNKYMCKIICYILLTLTGILCHRKELFIIIYLFRRGKP